MRAPATRSCPRRRSRSSARCTSGSTPGGASWWPPARKLVINALNSGAKGFMADFEDANSPTWRNQVEGQANLVDAVEGTIEFTDARTGRDYRLGEETATLL